MIFRLSSTLTGLIVVSEVVGDVCQDFCIAKLGRSECREESHCRDGLYCDRIFWLNEDKKYICVLDGSRGQYMVDMTGRLDRHRKASLGTVDFAQFFSNFFLRDETRRNFT